MDWQHFINAGVGAVITVGAWLFREIWNDLKSVKQEVDDYKLHVSETYVKKSEVDTLRAEMDKRFDRIETMINRLFEKIDMKVDK